MGALGLAALWPVFLIGACLHADDFWSLFNVFILALGVLPAMFGALSNQGLWGAIGDFIMGAILCSIFAYPIVLRNAGYIDEGAVGLIATGNFALLASAWLLVRS